MDSMVISKNEVIKLFNEYAQEYDEWFELNKFAYASEVKALKMLIPKYGKGLEVGVGTGRFALPLGIKIGVEPAKVMAQIAKRRGITVYESKAEKLPFNNSSFDYIVFITTLCFLQNPFNALKEAKRILKVGGHIIIGMINKDSSIGKIYKSKISKFYKHANFYSVDEVLDWLKKLEFTNFKACQTLFKRLEEMQDIDSVKRGYKQGGFVVISALKKSE